MSLHARIIQAIREQAWICGYCGKPMARKRKTIRRHKAGCALWVVRSFVAGLQVRA